MINDALSGAVSPTELNHFRARHPLFGGAVTRLQAILEQALARDIRPLADKPDNQQLVVFFLGHQAAEEFFEIVLLAVHGQGLGALRLLRSLYERVVTACYLIKHPEDVQDFNDYADLHARRVIHHAKAGGADVGMWVTRERVDEIEAAYQRVKSRFRETLCSKCRTTREQRSWTKKDLKTQADEVGLGNLYGTAAFWPTMLLHTTRVGLEARLAITPERFAYHHGPQREEADLAVSHAHALIVWLVSNCSHFFRWGIDVEPLLDDVRKCWGAIGIE